MRSFRILGVVLIAGLVSGARGEEDIYDGPGVKEVTELSVDEFTRLALQESLSARISRHSLNSATFGRQVSYLSQRFPTMALSATLSRTQTEPGAGGDNTSTGYNSSLTYTQPVYVSGGSLTGALTQSETRSVSRGSGPTFSGQKPSMSLSFTQPLFLFVGHSGKRSWRRTELGYESSLDGYETDRLGVVFEARNLYYRVLLKLAQLGVEKKKLVSSQEVLKITKALVNAGRMAPIESNRAELRFHTDERALQNARVSYWQILNEAKDKVGVSRETVVVFTSTLTYTPFNATLENLIEYAYIHQPGIRSARRAVEQGQISLRDAEEASRPTFSLSANLGMSKTPGGTVADKNWGTSLAMAWPFFDSRQKYYALLGSREALAISRLNLQAAERNLQLGVANAYVEVKRNEEQVLNFEQNRQQALDNVRIIKIRYRQGVDRLLDVFDAENEVRNLNLEYLNLLFSFSQSVDSISRQIGGDARKIK